MNTKVYALFSEKEQKFVADNGSLCNVQNAKMLLSKDKILQFKNRLIDRKEKGKDYVGMHYDIKQLQAVELTISMNYV